MHWGLAFDFKIHWKQLAPSLPSPIFFRFLLSHTCWILSSLTSRVLWNNCPQPSANSGSLRDTKLPFIVCWQKDLEHIKGKPDDVNQIWDFVIVAKILTYICRATKPPNLTRKRAWPPVPRTLYWQSEQDVWHIKYMFALCFQINKLEDWNLNIEELSSAISY